MVLIDSLYINDGGGKILLDYLVENVEKNNIECFYLFDNRCINDFSFIPSNRKLFLNASLFNRHQFYIKNKTKFSTVLCFGNLPPTVKLNVNVLTYFHNLLLLDLPKSLTLINKIKFKMKSLVLNSIKSNTDLWLVQSTVTKKRFESKFKIKGDKVRLLPFYPPLQSTREDYKQKEDSFIYISNGGKHKNHENLIKAFCAFYDQNKKGELHITISEKFPLLVQFIHKKRDKGYPIINHGFINRDNLVSIYRTSKFMIFPSLSESFGLGLVEAIENGCEVISANLPYTFAVCKPSIIFNPLDVNDIKRAFEESQVKNIAKTEQLVFNQIDKLIELLQ